jgi:subtilisin family serine protease
MRLLLLVTVLLSGCVSMDSRPLEERFAHQVVFTVANELAANPTLLTSYSHASFTDIEPTLIKERSQSMIDGVIRFHRLRKVSQWTIKSLGLEAVVAEFGGKKPMDEVIEDLAADERVDSVESVKAYRLLSYNDPYFQLQSYVKSDDIENVHRLATGKDVVIGVVDTGIDRTHPELKDRIIYSRNFVAHDQNRFDQDEHGTTVAGVIGSAANNELGIVGVAPDVKLMAFKSCWQDMLTLRAECDSVSLMKALVDVINQQPDIVNLSLAGPDDFLIRRLLKAASDRGIVLIAAVDPGSKSSFPASMDEVIAVGAPITSAEETDTSGIIAPGTDVLTTTPGATYAFRSGSSMSTAYISGVAALMKERQPTLSGEQIRVHLRSTSSSVIGVVPVVDMCAAVSQNGEACKPNSIVMLSEEVSPH